MVFSKYFIQLWKYWVSLLALKSNLKSKQIHCYHNEYSNEKVGVYTNCNINSDYNQAGWIDEALHVFANHSKLKIFKMFYNLYIKTI